MSNSVNNEGENRKPTGLFSLKHQVAGRHGGIMSNILCNRSGKIYKPFKPISNPTYSLQVNRASGTLTDEDMFPITLNELDFYKLVSETENTTLVKLKEFMPSFYGSSTIKEVEHLILEDITSKMLKPCVLDLKIGRCRNYPSRPKEKLLHDKTKYPSLLEVGYCIAGMKLYSTEDNSTALYLTPKLTHHFTTEDVKSNINYYLRDDHPASVPLRSFIRRKIEDIYDWASNQRYLILRGSSILIVYDGIVFDQSSLYHKEKATFQGNNCSFQTPAIDYLSILNPNVKLIDFAHAFYSEGTVDENYSFGVANLLEVLKD